MSERCAAYVVSSRGTTTEIASAVAIQRAIDAGNASARGRNFCCTHGHRLFFVRQSRTGSTAHFRHAASGAANEAASGASESATVACGCSRLHIEAQSILYENIGRLRVRSWRRCGQHAAGLWCATEGARVVLEKSDVFAGRRVRYDVAVYGADGLEKVIEVRHTSETRPERRPANTIEVDAGEIVREFAKNEGVVFVDNLMRESDECPECKAKAAEAAEAARIEQDQRRLRLAAERLAAARVKEAEQMKRVQMAEAVRAAQARRMAEAAQAAQKAEAVRVAQARRMAEAAQKAEAQRLRFAALDAVSAGFAKRRADVAQLAEVEPTPGFSRTIGTDVPEVSQEEIDRRRKERMDRQALIPKKRDSRCASRPKRKRI